MDSAAYGGWQIPPDYDSLVAKIIAFAPTRALAIRKMQTALEMTTIVGIKTNIPLHLQILANAEFLKGEHTTPSSWSGSWPARRPPHLKRRSGRRVLDRS